MKFTDNLSKTLQKDSLSAAHAQHIANDYKDQRHHGTLKLAMEKFTIVGEHYWQKYFEAIDLAILGIQDRFDQPEFAVYSNVESLLLKAARTILPNFKKLWRRF